MGVYSSLKLSRKKAVEIILKKVATATNDELRWMVGNILEDTTLYNCYMVVDGDEDDNDDRKIP
jgi:hypothetical protein